MSMLNQLLGRLLARGVLARTDDSGDLQMVQAEISGEETTPPLEHALPWGFSSHAPRPAHVIAAFLAGWRSRGVALAVLSPTDRPKGIPEGASVVYGAGGSRIAALPGGKVAIGKAGGDELLALVEELLNVIEAATTNPSATTDSLGGPVAIPPLSLLTTTVSSLAAIRARLQAIKGTLP